MSFRPIAAGFATAVDCRVCAATPGLSGRVVTNDQRSARPPGPEEAMREAHVPTQQPPTQQEARFSASHADPRRSSAAEEAAHEGPEPALRLIWRVRGPRAFRAFTAARRFRRGPLVLRCCPATEPGPPRVAFAVGRRSGGSVERNRIRRRLRPVVSAHAERLNADHQYLVGASAGALHASTAELNDAWLYLLERAHRDAGQ
jgi:ribonuclease P protein component